MDDHAHPDYFKSIHHKGGGAKSQFELTTAPPLLSAGARDGLCPTSLFFTEHCLEKLRSCFFRFKVKALTCQLVIKIGTNSSGKFMDSNGEKNMFQLQVLRPRIPWLQACPGVYRWLHKPFPARGRFALLLLCVSSPAALNLFPVSWPPPPVAIKICHEMRFPSVHCVSIPSD